MSEFLLVFRRDYKTKEVQPSAEELQKHIKNWQDWYGNLASQNILSKPVQRLDPKGKVLKGDNTVSENPYAEVKESIGGLITIKADDYDSAINIAKGSPIFELNGSVEVRQLS